MNSITMNNKNGPLALPHCPFLAFRPSSEDNQQGAFTQIICEAGGGYVLGTTESIASAQKVCLSCDIPMSLNLDYSCLFLVPFRVFHENYVQSYYGCRWYFSLNPRKTPKNTDWCMGCNAWFPRPRKTLVPGLIRVSHKFYRLFLNPSEIIDRPRPELREERRRWYEKLVDIFLR
jgi:hypothetical protein